jgi:uncharacterized protein (DUF2252 family)
MRRAMSRTWKHLADERLKHVTPGIPKGTRFWPLKKDEAHAIAELFRREDVRLLVTSLHSRPNDARIEVLDAAYWMKGCSSLGRLRYAVLISVGKGSRPEDFCLIDIKEAVPAAAPRASGSGMPRDNAQRVVSGARALSPNLGQRMMPAHFLNRSVFLRELLPQDLKVEMDQLTREEAVRSAHYLAWVVGVAHARQMDAASRTAWRRMLARQHSKRLSAPSWLWRSVVELVAAHEMAYLEHCRRYALTQR